MNAAPLALLACSVFAAANRRLPPLTQPLSPAAPALIPALPPLPDLSAMPALAPLQLQASEPQKDQAAVLKALTEWLAELPAPAPAGETDAMSAQLKFDGASLHASGGEPAIQADAPGWTRSSFESADGLNIEYKRRDGDPAKPARIFSGGLAMNESFEPLFALGPARAGAEYFLWTRSHPPTGWRRTAVPLDADARDLARLIVRAGPKAELVLHSYGTLVFQRMTQLAASEAEPAEALRRLSGQRVVMLHATTHYPGSERKAGPSFEQMATATRQFVDGLDRLDAVVAPWEAAAEATPWMRPQIEAMLIPWRAQREQLIALAARGAVDMMRADLAEKWHPSFDALRLAQLDLLERNARDAGWKEAMLRRSRDMFVLDFTKKDVQRLRDHGVRLEFVHGAGDKLLNWASAKVLFDLFGVIAPADAPPAGTKLSDGAGLFTARVVDGDHYFPLKKRGELSRMLAR